MSGENDVVRVYNYGDLSDDDKETASEIIGFLTKNSTMPIGMLCELLKQNFEIKEVPTRAIENSIWHEFTQDEPIGQTVQGHIQKGSGTDAHKIPFLGFSADLSQLDNIMLRLINKFQDVDINEINIRKKEYEKI